MLEPVVRGLVVAEHFVQGHGGTPESVLLLGQLLREQGVVLDVVAREGFVADVSRLRTLPDAAGELAATAPAELSSYRFVFFAGSWNPLFPRFLWRARQARIRTVYAAKGNLCRADFKRLRDLRKLAYLGLLEAPAVSFCDAIVFSSELERRTSLLPGPLRPREAHVVAEPFIGPALAPSPRPAGRPLTMGFLAEIGPRKGLMELAEGFKHWQATRPPARPVEFVIAGAPRPGSEAYRDACRALLAPFEQQGIVRWVGAKRGAARDAFYASLDVFLMPSRFESYGLTPLEALWHGKPVIASPHMGVMEYLAASSAVERLPDLGAVAIARALATVTGRIEVMQAAATLYRGRPLPGFYDAALAGRFLAALMRPEMARPGLRNAARKGAEVGQELRLHAPKAPPS